MNATVCKTPDMFPEFIESRDIKRQGLATVPRLLVGTLYTWQQRHTDRQNLMTLSDYQLVDIGIDRAEAWQEATKPFWKP